MSGPGEARTILLLHIISARPSKQPLMVRTFLKVYMELGSSFLFLQEQIKDIIIICVCLVRTGHGYLFGFICSCKCSGHPKDLPLWTAGRHLLLGWLFDRRNYPPGVDFFHTGVRRRKYKLGQTKKKMMMSSITPQKKGAEEMRGTNVSPTRFDKRVDLSTRFQPL